MQTTGYLSAGSGRFPIGMTIDFDGYVWAVNQSAASATKFDPVTKQTICEIAVGSGPYTYSDMTGYALHNFTAPQGYYKHVFGGWEGFRVKWTAVYVDVDYQDPENCFVKVRVRTGQDPTDLAGKPWQGYYGPYPPESFPLDLNTVPDMDGPLLEVFEEEGMHNGLAGEFGRDVEDAELAGLVLDGRADLADEAVPLLDRSGFGRGHNPLERCGVEVRQHGTEVVFRLTKPTLWR